MPNELILLLLCTFAAVALVSIGVLPVIATFCGAVWRAYQTDVELSARATPVLRQVYPLLQVVATYTRGAWAPTHKERLRKLLQYMGAPMEMQPEHVMAGCQLAAVVSFALAVLVLKGLLGMSLLACIPCGVAGYLLPLGWLQSRVADRRIGMQRQLPYMIDLVVMAMEAGSLFLDALEIYVRDHPTDTLAEEWRLFLNEINLGKTRHEALHNLAERVGLDDLRSLATTVAQGEEMGTPIGTLLRIYADGLRVKRSQRAEKLAGEAAVRILGPSMLMMLAVMVLILGPILIKYMRGELLL